MPDHYIGLISGTSMDGIDAVLVTFGEQTVSIEHALTRAYPSSLRGALFVVTRDPDTCTVDVIGELDRHVGECFRDAVLELLEAADVKAEDVHAIGSHGQTLRHCPDAKRPFTLQIGDPATIATGTDITTVADFRRADIALGGQGAPLVPPFHDWLFRSDSVDRAVLNVGGIANLTILPAGDAPVTGFDTGPGNGLMDAWILEHKGKPFDHDGKWAAENEPDADMLEQLLADPYFAAEPPKSTGFEHFNLDWLARHHIAHLDAGTVQATLLELTAASIATALERHAPETTELLVCGGGSHNLALMRRLSDRLAGIAVDTTDVAGLAADHVEACAFAWLAMRTLNQETGSAASVTGASRDAMLGAIHSS